MRIFAKAMTVFDRIVDVLAFLAIVLIILIMLLTCLSVLFRYLLFMPQSWVIEVCEDMLVFITFLGATWVLRKNGHVQVDILFTWLKPKANTILNLSTNALGTAICLLIFWYGLGSVLQHYHRGVYVVKFLTFPKFILLIVIPLGGIMLAMQFLRRVFGNIECLKSDANKLKP